MSYLVTRLKKGEDGKVAYMRVKGRKPTMTEWSLEKSCYVREGKGRNWKSSMRDGSIELWSGSEEGALN